MAFFLTNKAKSDLKSIARYTQKTWGIKQRNNYLTKLDNAFHTLSNHPQIGSGCDYIRLGYFKFPTERHIIFYKKINQKDIKIVRILHTSMDVAPHF